MLNSEFKMEMLKDYENKIFWTISHACNFKCPYCYIDKNCTSPYVTKNYTPEFISECFNKIGKSWLIMLAGGEPFLMPKFLDLIKLLTENHHIQISTNLCSDDIYKLPNYVLPERIMVISASFHVVQRELYDPGFERFIEKYLFLEQKGYRVVVNYVAWPPLLKRIEKDFEYLRNKGIKNITAFSFLGEWDGKLYPNSYSKEEIKLITQLSMYNRENEILHCKTKYKGIECEAGNKYFTTDIEGNIYQCRSTNIKHGNIFDGSFKSNMKNNKCKAEYCIDTYMGDFILHRKSMFNLKSLFGK